MVTVEVRFCRLKLPETFSSTKLCHIEGGKNCSGLFVFLSTNHNHLGQQKSQGGSDMHLQNNVTGEHFVCEEARPLKGKGKSCQLVYIQTVSDQFSIRLTYPFSACSVQIFLLLLLRSFDIQLRIRYQKVKKMIRQCLNLCFFPTQNELFRQTILKMQNKLSTFLYKLSSPLKNKPVLSSHFKCNLTTAN